MASISNYLEDVIINYSLRNVTAVIPATKYVALFLTDPTDADVGTEVSGGSYARQSIAFAAPTNGITQNTALITFPVATANWGVVRYVGVYDAIVGGNLLFHSKMVSDEQVLSGQTFTFPIGGVVVSIS